MGTSKKLWGGRFNLNTDGIVEKYTASIDYDKRLYPYDIEGSVAHCRMLAKQGIIENEEADQIIEALGRIRREIDQGEFKFDAGFEDIHMNIESRLIDLLGPLGQKLHTARSRNDQVALDLRMYLKEAIETCSEALRELCKALVIQAKNHLELVLPGYTHLQRAQPVLLAHHLLAYVEMFYRDLDRLRDCARRVNVLPLGSAALGGTPFPIDREYTAELLGFDAVSRNSIDAVSDRDFVAEFLFDMSMIMMHASRMAEELVLWSTKEFDFVEMSDAHTTGSSIMPQKKNPDVAELARGKTGRVYGSLVSVLTMMKGLPLSYNRDMQEDKEPVFDAADTVSATLSVFVQVIRDLKFNRERMFQATQSGFLTATDLADYLVRKGFPFRRAHHIVGEMVQYALNRGKELHELELSEMREFSTRIDEDVYHVLEVNSSLETRKVQGGTSPECVRQELKRFEKELWDDDSQH